LRILRDRRRSKVDGNARGRADRDQPFDVRARGDVDVKHGCNSLIEWNTDRPCTAQFAWNAIITDLRQHKFVSKA
jgi:hypothetical protein